MNNIINFIKKNKNKLEKANYIISEHPTINKIKYTQVIDQAISVRNFIGDHNTDSSDVFDIKQQSPTVDIEMILSPICCSLYIVVYNTPDKKNATKSMVLQMVYHGDIAIATDDNGYMMIKEYPTQENTYNTIFSKFIQDHKTNVLITKEIEPILTLQNIPPNSIIGHAYSFLLGIEAEIIADGMTKQIENDHTTPYKSGGGFGSFMNKAKSTATTAATNSQLQNIAQQSTAMAAQYAAKQAASRGYVNSQVANNIAQKAQSQINTQIKQMANSDMSAIPPNQINIPESIKKINAELQTCQNALKSQQINTNTNTYTNTNTNTSNTTSPALEQHQQYQHQQQYQQQYQQPMATTTSPAFEHQHQQQYQQPMATPASPAFEHQQYQQPMATPASPAFEHQQYQQQQYQQPMTTPAATPASPAFEHQQYQQPMATLQLTPPGSLVNFAKK